MESLLRVLVVDDEQEFVEALVERLNLRGLHASGVTNGSQAIECIEEGEYDVMLLDVKMPPPGGLEVLRKAKQRWPRRPVVLLTGHGSADDARLGMECGACDCVMKPVEIEALVAILLKAAAASGATER